MAIDRAKISKNANAYLSSGKVEKAIEEFRKLVDDNPKDYNTLNQIGDLYIQINRTGEGVEIHKRLGLAYERDGFHARAAAIMQKVCRNAPDDIDAAQRLAELYRQMNKTGDAVKVHLQVAEHFTKKGLIKRALEEFTKVVDLDPKNLKMKVKLADLYNKEGMKDRAAGIYLEVAEALALEQKHQEANQILERAKTMITTPQVYLTQSRLCVIQQDYAGAAGHLREGLTTNPRSMELLEALAEIEIRAGNADRALEALTQVPQLPERSLHLCEKALRQLAGANRADEGLRLFQPIAQELARRGAGDAVARTLKTGLNNQFTVESLILLAEIAHQSGKRDERITYLQHAHAQAEQSRDANLVAHVKGLLTAAGGAPGAGTPLPSPAAAPSMPSLPSGMGMDSTHGGLTEVDPLKRIKVEQLSKEAEALLRTGSGDRAIEAYKKALELDPANVTLIDAIADIHRKSGFLGKAQMQYMQSGEQLLKLGRKREALMVLDKAEGLFPNSTRLIRRMNSLPDFVPGQASAQALPQAPIASQSPIALGPPPEAIPMAEPAPPMPEPLSDFDALIALDDGAESLPALEFPPLAPPPSSFALPPDLSGGLTVPGFDTTRFPDMGAPTMPLPPLQELEPLAELPAEPAAPASAPPELDWMDTTAIVEPPAPAALPSHLVPISQRPDFMLPPAEAAPLAFDELQFPEAEALVPEVPETMPVTEILPEVPLAPLALPPLVSAAGPEISEELDSLLSDIDFQLDYGSPEEASLEIKQALKDFHDHPELLARLEKAENALRKLGHVEKAEKKDDDFENSFFDLTDVLGTSLMDQGEGEEMHDTTNVVEKVQSVEELFDAFRSGVEQQVNAEDYDTHYNLGIAYKEMMLIDAAIEEFKKAMGDPERTLECCSMLAICEQARGDFDASMTWLNEGIHAPGFPPEDSVGLRYDLAELYLQQGHTAMAQEEFRRVYDMDPDYRDVAARIG
ncbi:MAG TPA: tetratricopeptide repeat protein [Holophagaceae bacterium]|nr:tetratricopeptide repeat protein [Holophagaceae bacterium]